MYWEENVLLQLPLLTKNGSYTYEANGVLFFDHTEIRILRTIEAYISRNREDATMVILKDGSEHVAGIPLTKLLAMLKSTAKTSWEHLAEENGL